MVCESVYKSFSKFYLDWGFNNDIFNYCCCNKKMKKLILLTPLIVLTIICLFFLLFIIYDKDPNNPPSALLNKDAPTFLSINLYDENDNFISEDLRDKYTLINFFASWCTPCKIEHPLFLELASEYPSLFILGFNHKDKQLDEDVKRDSLQTSGV